MSFDSGPYINAHPGEPDQPHHNAIGDVRSVTRATQLETKTTIYHAQGDEYPPKPDVGVTDRGSPRSFLVLQMVQDAASCLHEDSSKQHKANYAMILIDLNLLVNMGLLDRL